MKGKALWLALGALLLVPAAAMLVVSVSDGSRTPSVPEPSAGSSATIATTASAPVVTDHAARRDPARSAAELAAALEKAPTDDALMLQLTEKLLMKEDHRAARNMVLRCLEANPKNHGCQEARRHILTPQKVHDDTTPFLKNCLERDPKSAPCLGAKVVEAVRNEQPEEARQAADALRAAHPDSPLSTLSDGRIFSLAGDYAKARERFEKACEAGQAYGCYRAESLRKEGW